MKTKITILLMLLISITTSAQQGINYKAIIKDGSGNVVTTPITVRFAIYKGAALINNVYQETHNTTPNANGLTILNIGTGTVDSGIFANIDWASSDSHFLNVEINTGAVFVDMGTTEFMAVPYAMHSKTSEAAENVTGLEQITEGGNTGWRLIGVPTSTRADIGDKAIDMSYSFTITHPLTNGATGSKSFAIGSRTEASGENSTAMGNRTEASGFASTAMGEETTASGDYSSAMGRSTTASGNYSTAMGENTTASGDYSTAMGRSTTALGNYSIAMGRSTTAPSYGETSIGIYTANYTATATTHWNVNDRLFVIGNGTLSVPNNALTVLKNGNAKFDGKIQHTSTGNANMIPIAYGIVESNGNILTGTGNFTAFLSGNVFIIDVNGTESLNYNSTVCLITPISTSSRTSSTIIDDGNGDNDKDLNVRIFNASGTQVLTTFQFVIYRL